MSHIYPVLLALSGNVLLFFPFRQLLDGLFDSFLEHSFSLLSLIHPLNQKVNDKDRINLKISAQINPLLLLLLLNNWRLLCFLCFSLLLHSSFVLLHGLLLLLTSLLLFLQSLLKHGMLLLFTDVSALVSHLVHKEVELLNGVHRQGFLQKLEFLLELFLSTCPLQLLPHFVIEDEVCLLNQNIYNFRELFLRYNECLFLLLLLLVTQDVLP